MTTATMKTSTLYSIYLLLPPALGHMALSWPYPFRSAYNPQNTYTNIDYSMSSPLNPDGSNFPCKGYQNDGTSQPTATYTAGSTYNMTLAGSATHGGGSCQLSLSYDKGATFRVIKSLIGGCPLVSTYDFTIPSYAPAGDALFAWTWSNYEGNREFYMNCAPVSIVAGYSSRIRRRRTEYNSFDSLPYLWVANLADVNDCTTTRDENPVYPNPGPDVQYGGGMDSSSPPSEGDCDSPSSSAQTPQPSFTYAPASAESSATSTPVIPPAPYYDATTTAPTTSSDPVAYSQNPFQRAFGNGTSTQSTTTITVDECPETITITVEPSTWPPAYTTSKPAAACTGTSASCPCASGYQCNLIGPCDWECIAQISTTWYDVPERTPPAVTVTLTPPSVPAPPTSTPAAPSTSSWFMVTYTATVSPVPASSTPSQPTSTQTPPAPSQPIDSSTRPPYVTGDPEAYLPCVPGTFICTSDSTWQTCDYSDGSDPAYPTGSWIYDYPRDVSAGMMCLPYLSPYSSQTDADGQQAMTPQGYYRDDRVVRARPDGDCSDEGSIQCTNGGGSFDVCDQGGWVPMGPVASGTTCENGQIVAS